MYYPGMERYYNEVMSPRLTISLAVWYRYANAEVPQHPGIPQDQSTHDEITPDFFVRPHLPPSPIRVVEYNNNVVVIRRTTGGSANA